MDKEIPQVFLLGAGKYDNGTGIELLRSQHRPNGIKIRIHVTGDDCLRCNLFFAQRLTPVEKVVRNLYTKEVQFTNCQAPAPHEVPGESLME
ncbi:MAG: hypothetical protein MI802_26655 [Desulfobacterales bacterium]|nr:hypothetical protein [Desulfobacterales bacterium]